MSSSLSRLGTAYIFNDRMSSIMDAQSNLEKISGQISSGVKVKDYKDLAENGQVRLVIDSLDKKQKVADYLSSNILALGRVEQAINSVTTIFDVTSNLQTNLATRISPAGEEMNFEQILKDGLKNIENALNSSFMGRYIFAGSQTNVIPVRDIVIYSNIINGEATNNYCLADDYKTILRADDSLVIEYGVTAHEEAFQKAIGAAHLALEAERGDAIIQRQRFEEAIVMFDEAIAQLNTLRTKMGNNTLAIENINSQHTDLNIYLNKVLDENLNTDIPEATLKASLDEAIIRASFMVYSKLAGLNLTDYIR
jgi:flagellar hook-associated protein 3 FlgL